MLIGEGKDERREDETQQSSLNYFYLNQMEIVNSSVVVGVGAWELEMRF